MSNNTIPHDDARREQLAFAKQRLTFRLEFALLGRPAWPATVMGYAILDNDPIVKGAPPYAEDPRTVTELIARVDAVIASEEDYTPC